MRHTVNIRRFNTWRNSIPEGWKAWEPITSLKNDLISLFKRVNQGENTNLVFLEGHRVLIDVLSMKNVEPVQILLSPEALNAPLGGKLVERLTSNRVDVKFATNKILEKLSHTMRSQGACGLFKVTPLEIPVDAGLVVVLDGISDPGNMGTIIRTSYGLGADALIARGGCHIMAPKVIRSSMAYGLNFPLIQVETWAEVISLLGSKRKLFIADAKAPAVDKEPDYTPPLALVMGSEANGVQEEGVNLLTRNFSVQQVAISMREGCESLNAGVACAVLMGEIARQRRISRR